MDIGLIIAIVVAAIIVLGILVVILGKGKSGKKGKKKGGKTETMVGKKCVVTEEIDNQADTGLIKLEGMVWKARGEADGEKNVKIAKGETVEIVSNSGVNLIVRKIEE